MRALIVGGTGFIGVHAAQALARRGVGTTALADRGWPEAVPRPEGLSVVVRDLAALGDEELLGLLRGHEAVVFAAGADDRLLPRAPALDFFRKANVEAAARTLRLAARAGASGAVLLGSYFAHFHRAWPELDLAGRHPYVRSRVEQEAAVLALDAPGFAVSVLELPYVFGALPGQRPLWAPLLRYLARTPAVLYPAGGSNAVAVRAVAEAIAGAVVRRARGAFAVGDENLTWPQLLGRLLAAAGRKRRVVTVPRAALVPVAALLKLQHRLRGRQSGLEPVSFLRVQTRCAFFDPAPAQAALGFAGGGLDEAIAETVKASLG